VSEVVCGDAEVAEFPAVFVSISSIQADGVGGLVHESAVTGSHHVTTQAGVDGGAVHLISGITTVVISIASPGGVNTTSVTAFPLSGGVTSARKLIRSIVTIIVSVTHPSFVNAFGTVFAFVLKVIAVTSAVPLIPVVATVVISITNPGGLDTQVVVTLDLSRGTIHFVTVLLISIITTVVVTITLEFFRDTFAVSAFQLVGSRTVAGAVGLVRSISAVTLCVTNPVSLYTLAVLTGKLSGSTGSNLPLVVTCLGVHVLVVLLPRLGLSEGDGHKQNQTDFEQHDV